MAGEDPLRRYRGKRDFGATGEPRGDDEARGRRGEEARGDKSRRGHEGASESADGPEHRGDSGSASGQEGTGRGGGDDTAGDLPSYVVQIHDASTMHFDFRLEVDGVLKSWAVPKGPSTDPGDKRLAVPTEDHPLEYREYEGTIDRGEYGAGTVIVWDTGTYRPLGKDGTASDAASFAKALAEGHASFWLDGAKLKGGYVLTRFRGGGGAGHEEDGEEAWLLVKRADAKADRSGTATPDPRRARSALSGRTLHQVERDDGDHSGSHRDDGGQSGGHGATDSTGARKAGRGTVRRVDGREGPGHEDGPPGNAGAGRTHGGTAHAGRATRGGAP